ncbi:MAG: PLDc N-terminal domain-containing protein [Rubrobacteraceae bacterium]
MPNKRWGDLSSTQRKAVVLSGVVQLGLLAAALADIYRRPAQEIRGDKRLWAVVAFVNFVGPVSYFLFGHRR